MPDLLTLQIPSDAAYIATARLFAASVARHFAVDEELIPDLKLAISEACAGDILVGGAGSAIHISATAGEDRLGFEVTQPEDGESPGAPSDATPTPGETAQLAMEVIQALFEDAEVVDGPDGRVIRFGTPTGSL